MGINRSDILKGRSGNSKKHMVNRNADLAYNYIVMAQQKVKDTDGQAERTAWRNVRDWVLAQVAIIEAGMVQIEEVFLPYMTDGSGRTLYQLYQGGHLALGGGQE